jgi:hypothetical protein
MADTPSILIGTPCYGGLVTHTYMHSLINLMSHPASRNIKLGLWTAANDSLITRSRNSIVSTFLDNPSATHLMFIDADIGFSPEQFHRLVAADQDLVAGMYPIKNIDWDEAKKRSRPDMTPDEMRTAGYHYVGVPLPRAEREELDGFVTGECCGAGFMLIKRRALKQLIAAYPETKFKSIQTYPAPKAQSENQYALFDCMIDPDTGAYLSEDFAFCHRYRRIGGKVWLDTKSELQHTGSHEFRGAITKVL